MLAIILAIIAGPWPNTNTAKWPPVAPIVAPTETVKADAKGHWETRTTCGRYGCGPQAVWVADKDSQVATIDAATQQASDTQGSTHTRRRGPLRRLLFGR